MVAGRVARTAYAEDPRPELTGAGIFAFRPDIWIVHVRELLLRRLQEDTERQVQGQWRTTVVTQRGMDKMEQGGNVWARLVSELGRAAHAGWGPTVRWLIFLVVIASTLDILAALRR